MVRGTIPYFSEDGEMRLGIIQMTNILTEEVHGHVPLSTIANGRRVEVRHDPRVEWLVSQLEDIPGYLSALYSFTR